MTYGKHVEQVFQGWVSRASVAYETEVYLPECRAITVPGIRAPGLVRPSYLPRYFKLIDHFTEHEVYVVNSWTHVATAGKSNRSDITPTSSAQYPEPQLFLWVSLCGTHPS